jgi:hypothetical protein
VNAGQDAAESMSNHATKKCSVDLQSAIAVSSPTESELSAAVIPQATAKPSDTVSCAAVLYQSDRDAQKCTEQRTAPCLVMDDLRTALKSNATFLPKRLGTAATKCAVADNNNSHCSQKVQISAQTSDAHARSATASSSPAFVGNRSSDNAPAPMLSSTAPHFSNRMEPHATAGNKVRND